MKEVRKLKTKENKNKTIVCIEADLYKNEDGREAKDNKGAKEERARKKKGEEALPLLDAAVPQRGGRVPT